MTTYIKKKRMIGTSTLAGASLLTAISIILTRVFAVMIPLAGLPALRIGFGDIPVMISGILFGPIAGALTGITADLLGVMINPMGGFFPGFTLSAALRGAIPGLIYWAIKSKKTKFNFNIINTITIIALASGVLNILYTNDVLKFKKGAFYLYEQQLSFVLISLFIVVVLGFILIPIIVSRRQKEVYSNYSLDKILFTVTIAYLIISLGLNTLWLSIMFNKGFMIFLPGRIFAGFVMIPLHSLIIYSLSRFFKYMKK